MNVKVEAKISVSLATKQYMSVTYLSSVINFLNKLRYFEENYEELNDDKARNDYYSYSISSIILSIAFFESTINEFFDDISHNIRLSSINNQEGILNEQYINTVKFMKDENLFRRSGLKMFEKYNIALKLGGKSPISKEEIISRELKILVELRNELVHADPEWIWLDENEKLQKSKTLEFENKFKNKFNTNPYVKGGPFFPNRCIGYGCAKWAISTVVNYSDEFFKRMELVPRYEHMKNELSTLI